MLPVDFLLMVNSIRGRILLIVCHIFLRNSAAAEAPKREGYRQPNTNICLHV